MTLFLCKLWPYLAGGLIGWLLAGWLARRLKNSEPPVEKIVEKHIDRVVDNPEHLEKINQLEAEIRSLKQNNSSAASRNTKAYGIAGAAATEADKPATPVSPGSAPTPAASTPTTVPIATTSSTSSKDDDSASEKSQPKPASAATTVDIVAAKKAGFRLKQKNGQDDFTVVEGIGPKINELIHDADIHYYSALAKTSVNSIQKILDDAGPRYKLAKPGTWPKQAELAAENKWEALKTLQDELDGGQ